MSDCCWRSWVKKTLKCVRSDVESTHASVGLVHAKLDMIMEELRAMGVREEAAEARLAELVQLVKDGSAAKDAKIAALEAELANADADAQARVDAALEADSEFDAGRIEAANTALEELVAVVPPVEEPPAEEPVQ